MGETSTTGAGRRAKLSLPVSVGGAMLSVGDGRFTQGDGEIDGAGLEGSMR